LQLKDVAGITEAGNTASQKVLLKNGFEFEKTYMEKEKELFLYRKRFSITV
jgi:RimJ/RimL family protein N-acetyltransferase